MLSALFNSWRLSVTVLLCDLVLGKIMDIRDSAHLRLLGALTTGKRFSAHITELMFENFFSDRFSQNATFGTIKVSGPNYDNYFYSFVNNINDYPLALTKLSSFKKVSVFIVTSNSESCVELLGDRLELKSNLGFEVFELFSDGRLVLSEAKSEDLSGKLVNGIGSFDLNRKPDFDISEFIDSVSSDKVRKLIFNRLLLDVAFKDEYPVDIDVIDLCENGLVFFEFKRKTPAHNLVSIPCNIGNVYELRKTQSTIKKVITSMVDMGSYVENFKHLASQMDGQFEQKECFSLDFSHASNLFLCKELKIRYVYIVWEQKSVEISKLITKDLMPVNSNCFFRLMPSQIDGVTFTKPDDAGDVGARGLNYIRNPRIQYVFKKERFAPIKQLFSWLYRLRKFSVSSALQRL